MPLGRGGEFTLRGYLREAILAIKEVDVTNFVRSWISNIISPNKDAEGEILDDKSEEKCHNPTLTSPSPNEKTILQQNPMGTMQGLPIPPPCVEKSVHFGSLPELVDPEGPSASGILATIIGGWGTADPPMGVLPGELPSPILDDQNALRPPREELEVIPPPIVAGRPEPTVHGSGRQLSCV